MPLDHAALMLEAAMNVVEQTGCTEAEARARIKDFAARLSRTEPDTALLVVAGIIRFDE